MTKSSEEREKIKDSVQCTVMCVLCFFIRLLCAIKTDHTRPAFSHDCLANKGKLLSFMFMRASLTLKERYKSKYPRTRDTLLIDQVEY